MHRKLAMLTVLVVLGVIGAGTAVAGQPDNPGCFGRDRAEFINTQFKNGGALDTGPGASEWGAIAGERAGTNGDLNRAYKETCGGNPSE
jgi:hypothetical protein